MLKKDSVTYETYETKRGIPPIPKFYFYFPKANVSTDYIRMYMDIYAS